MSKYLKPAEGRTVDQENGMPWPVDGMEAPDTLFVRRRLADGDLIETDAPAVAVADVSEADASSDDKTTTKPKGGK